MGNNPMMMVFLYIYFESSLGCAWTRAEADSFAQGGGGPMMGGGPMGPGGAGPGMQPGGAPPPMVSNVFIQFDRVSLLC